jgi:endonuclease G
LLGLAALAAAAQPGAWVERWGRPKHGDLVLLSRRAYELGFSSRLRVARWVAYCYTPTGNVEARGRGGPFRADPEVAESCRVTPADYAGTYRRNLRGFDKGHQAPDAALRAFGRRARDETYLLTNITPQHSLLNQRLWRDLEDAIRDSTLAGETTWVVTGPVFFAGRETAFVGRRRVAVPHAYFCSWRHSRRAEFVTLLAGNDSLGHEFVEAPGLLVSVDSVERLTGLDLYPSLSTREARRREAQPATALWPNRSKRGQ